MRNRYDIDNRIAQLQKENNERFKRLLPKSPQAVDQKKAFENGLALGKIVAILVARSGGKNPFSKKGLMRIIASSLSYYLTGFVKRKIK